MLGIESPIDARDRAGRERAVDPRFNVALEASAGTGKTRVLVDRYINLLRAGVDPSNILAITFTRKAAAEMRERIMATLREAAARGEIAPAQWRQLRDRTADIAISTIDAFCLSLLREFPLEADLDPGFSLADDTEVPRLIDESLDRALRICRATARDDENVALVFAQLGDRRARKGLAALLNRRIVAPRVLARFLARGPRDLDVTRASRGAAAALVDALGAMPGGLDRFIETGPLEPPFILLARDLRALETGIRDGSTLDPATVQAAFARARAHFLTQDGTPRKSSPFPKSSFAPADWQLHKNLVVDHADRMLGVFDGYRRDLNVLVSRGVSRMFAIAEREYRRTLDAHAILDFSDVLMRALALLSQMDEFSRSRYRLESRYHHVLVDEFQDTSRAQWELVSLLIQSWGEGAGLAGSGPLQPSIFIVGDRKQSIYGFRDAEVSVMREAGRYIGTLRREGDVRRSISRSFRAVPPLLSFINDVCHDVEKAAGRRDGFEYEEEDRFPIDSASARRTDPVDPPDTDALGLISADTPEGCAETTADEIARLIAEGTPVRDRDTGAPRPVRAGDIAILFRTRESHREFESALEGRGISAYVYKGLGFFDADEIKDVLALLWYLADPVSDLRTAALMRSRLVRLSDEALRLLAPRLADALLAADRPAAASAFAAADARALDDARAATAQWRALADRLPPAELVDRILTESGYFAHLGGPRFAQARENLKKMRALVRRIQNRGYSTLGRMTAHLDRLAVGDEANAVVDALDAVNLMTVHAAKGLEFPIVFLVNVARGTANRRDPIRIAPGVDGNEEHDADVSVAVGDYQSDADEDETARQREETKRLLYVALTRARDRLYLGTVLKEGRIQPGRGSLGEVLPATLLELFSPRAPEAGVEWRASSGQAHRFRLADHKGPPRVSDAGADFHGPREGDFAPLVDSAPCRTTVAAVTSDEVRDASSGSGHESDRLIGALVHRLLQRFGFDAGAAIDRDAVLRVLRAEEETSCVDAVLSAYQAMCGTSDVRALWSARERLHEVPFTMRTNDVIVRGTIDCLVRTAPGQMTLLEFKTGRPRAEHREQLDLYVRAAQLLFADATVDGRLVYVGPAV